MIVRSAQDVGNAGHFVDGGNWTSARYLTRADNVPYSLNDTWVRAGTTNIYEYANHIEACLCIEGTGTVEALATGEVRELGPGVMYCLDKHDRHRVVAKTDMRLICVFTPALAGTEKHDARGAYSAA